MSRTNKRPWLARSSVVVLLLALGSMVLTGCRDDDIIAAGKQLSVDGKAASDAYSAYVNTTLGLLERQCQLSAVEFAFAGRANLIAAQRSSREPALKPEQIVEKISDCATDPGLTAARKRLKEWASDGEAVGKAYVVIARITDEANADAAQKSLDKASSDIAGLVGLAVSPWVQQALAELAKVAVHRRQANELVNYAKALQGLPDALTTTLNLPPVVDALKTVYTQYDRSLSNARKQALNAGMIDGNGLVGDALGFKVPGDKESAPYFGAFAFAVMDSQKTIEAGETARTKVSELLKTVSASTANLITSRSRVPTQAQELADAKTALGAVKAIADASRKAD